MKNQQKKTAETSSIQFSVVIPLYNKETTVERALRSVLNQEVQDFEIIVVNDGSTDNGPAIVQTFADSRIRLINQENQGVSAARQRGIAEARNELIAFLDADDEWLSGFLATIHQLVLSHPQCVVYGTRYLIGIPDGTYPCLIRGLNDGFSGVMEDYFIIAAKSDSPIHSSAVVVKKTAINAVGGFPLGIKYGEDILTWARLACTGRIAYTMRPESVYWLALAQVYQDKPSRELDPADRVGKALKKLLAECPMADAASLKAYIALWHKVRALSYLRYYGMRITAVKEMALFIRYCPQPKSFLYFFLLFFPTAVVNRIFRYKTQKNRVNRLQDMKADTQ